jgi:hypothetical protein
LSVQSTAKRKSAPELSAKRPLTEQNLSAQPEDGRQRFVDTPLLIWRDPPYQVAKVPGVDGADLLDENASSLAQQFDLRTERRRPGAERGRRATSAASAARCRRRAALSRMALRMAVRRQTAFWCGPQHVPEAVGRSYPHTAKSFRPTAVTGASETACSLPLRIH